MLIWSRFIFKVYKYIQFPILVQVMLWLGAAGQQVEAIIWTNFDLDPCRHMALLGPNELKQLSYLLKIIDILLIIPGLEKWNKGLEKVWKRFGIPCQ